MKKREREGRQKGGREKLLTFLPSILFEFHKPFLQGLF